MARQSSRPAGWPGASPSPGCSASRSTSRSGARSAARDARPDGRWATRWSARARALALAGAVALPLAGAAHADDYDPQRAGHPLRIAAYVLHPVGVTIDYLLMRPAHWLVSHEPLRTFFGHTDD